MTTANPFSSVKPNFSWRSFRWDIVLPLAVAIAPACIFRLIGLLGVVLNGQRLLAPIWIVSLITLEFLGIIAMALVTMMRLDFSRRRLFILTAGHPPWWRKSFLLLSVACLLLFDILVNLSGAFAGAEIFFFVALPFFLAYLLFYYLAFLRLY